MIPGLDLLRPTVFCLVVALVLLALPGAASGAPDPPLSRSVYLLTPASGGDWSRLGELVRATQARLAAYPVTIRLLGVDARPDATAAGRLAAETGALSVAWLDAGGSTFHVMTPLLGGEVTTRALSGEDGSWLGQCQAMAAILHAELAPLLTGPLADAGRTQVDDAADAPGDSAMDPGASDAGDGASDAAAGDPAGAPAAEDPPSPARPQVAALVLAAFALSRPDPGMGAVPAVDLAGGVRIGRHAELRAGARLGSPAPLELAGANARIARWPLRVVAGARVPIGPVDLAGEIGTVVDLWRLRDLDADPADPSVPGTHADLGLTAAFVVAVRAAAWFAPFAAVGVDAFGERVAFVLRDQTLAERGAIVPHLRVGVAWTIGRGGER